MILDVIDINGKKIKEIDVNDYVFGIEPNKYSIYESIKNELANKRQGTLSTKTKAEVSGSGKKPWKQKGTGRARVGTIRNPIWRHGGIAFGPKPRDFSYRIPKKVKNLAYRSILSLRKNEGKLLVVNEIPVKEGKTKEFLRLTNNIIKNDKEKVTIISTDKDVLLRRSSRNLPNIINLSCNRLNVCDLFYSKQLIITEESVNILNNLLNKAG